MHRRSAVILLCAAACNAPDASEETAAPEVKAAPPAALAPKAACAPARTFVGAGWPEADALFHTEPRWLGADAAYSVPLGGDRILWLFGDSFIAKTSARRRAESTFIRNSIAIQTGTDPTRSTISFHWREGTAGASSFFAERGGRWFWPLHGARVGPALVLFLNELERSDGGLGFASVGTALARIANPDDVPDRWSIAIEPLPADGREHGVSVVAEGGFLYGMTTRKTVFFDVELERWPVASIGGAGALWNGKQFAGAKGGAPIWTGGAPEFSTAARCGEWVTVESNGFGATDLAVRRARALTGPWSAPAKVFHPPESDRPKPFVYAGKVHSALTGAALVATYAANSFDFAEVIRDDTLYWPRFVRIDERR